MKRKLYLILLYCIATGIGITGCSHSTLGRLVGGDRDDHGCLTAAGYTWSDALHDCVRVWEVGERFDEGPKQIFLVYSTDSLFAEIFSPDQAPILCKRVKGTTTWQAPRGKEQVFISNGITTVRVNDYNYTKKLP